VKRAKSDLIDIFLRDVKQGNVSGRGGSSGPEILRLMVAALQGILDGKETDQVLQIERQPGQPPNVENIKLAILIHQQRKVGEKWSVVELIANDWLKSEDLEPLSLARIRAIYKQHRSWLQQRDDIELMAKKTQQATQQRRRKSE
jgi:hypothetical protein